MLESLKKYRQLCKKIDVFAEKLLKKHADSIHCAPGCSECCILETLFPIEAYSIGNGVKKFSAVTRKWLQRNSKNRNRKLCVFLKSGKCLVYSFRPIICRTQGYPLLLDGRVDFCPKNFQGVRSLDGASILELETITTLLVKINMLFVREMGKEHDENIRVKLSDVV